jgi:predicted metal-dependent phosphoesterase TrpH
LKADLHLHTTASDGKLSPAELVKLSVTLKLDVISITDHDTVNGISPALSASKEYSSLTVIPGVELSTDVPCGEIHMLGYFVDYRDEALADSLATLRSSREGRALKMVVKLGELGMNIDLNRIKELAQGGSVGRPHIAQVLLESGYVATFKEAFDKYIGRNGPAYAEREKMTPIESIELIKNAGGLPVLAHPANIEDLDSILPELKKAGLVGIEVFYTKYTAEIISRLLTLATRYKLVTTGGTDYHHFQNDAEDVIGSVPIPPDSVKQLISLSKKQDQESLT